MDSALARIFDANANRAREALRVIEDYARFALNSDPLSQQLKDLRHDFSALTRPYTPTAIFSRDTVGDVGTDNKTASEFKREDLASIVIAAGKRLGEALRVLEETLKTADAQSARSMESLRYRFYTLEKTIALTLNPASRFNQVQLYVLITQGVCRLDWEETTKKVIAAGADCIQLREKELEGAEFLNRAKRFVHLCRDNNVLSIINDRLDIAMLADADGVHLGQTDLPAADARKLLGVEKLIGVSTHSLNHARKALLDSADYIGVGPVFPSTTKPRDILPGLDYAQAAATNISIPTVAIAGITLANLDQVLQTGVRAVAVASAITNAADPFAATSDFKKKLVAFRASNPVKSPV